MPISYCFWWSPLCFQLPSTQGINIEWSFIVQYTYEASREDRPCWDDRDRLQRLAEATNDFVRTDRNLRLGVPSFFRVGKERRIQLLDYLSVASPQSGVFSDWSRNKRYLKLSHDWLPVKEILRADEFHHGIWRSERRERLFPALNPFSEGFVHETIKDERIECTRIIVWHGSVSRATDRGFGKSAIYPLIPKFLLRMLIIQLAPPHFVYTQMIQRSTHVRSPSPVVLESTLNHDIIKLTQWFLVNHLQVNAAKTQAMTLGKSQFTYRFSVKDQILDISLL